MTDRAHRRLARRALRAMPPISRALARGDHADALARLAIVYRDAGADPEDAVALAFGALERLT